jgi:hypothetical protein
LSVTPRSVSGKSGIPVNVVELLLRSTVPVSASENGGPNTRVSAGAVNDPVR